MDKTFNKNPECPACEYNYVSMTAYRWYLDCSCLRCGYEWEMDNALVSKEKLAVSKQEMTEIDSKKE